MPLEYLGAYASAITVVEATFKGFQEVHDLVGIYYNFDGHMASLETEYKKFNDEITRVQSTAQVIEPMIEKGLSQHGLDLLSDAGKSLEVCLEASKDFRDLISVISGGNCRTGSTRATIRATWRMRRLRKPIISVRKRFTVARVEVSNMLQLLVITVAAHIASINNEIREKLTSPYEHSSATWHLNQYRHIPQQDKAHSDLSERPLTNEKTSPRPYTSSQSGQPVRETHIPPHHLQSKQPNQHYCAEKDSRNSAIDDPYHRHGLYPSATKGRFDSSQGTASGSNAGHIGSGFAHTLAAVNGMLSDDTDNSLMPSGPHNLMLSNFTKQQATKKPTTTTSSQISLHTNSARLPGSSNGRLSDCETLEGRASADSTSSSTTLCSTAHIHPKARFSDILISDLFRTHRGLELSLEPEEYDTTASGSELVRTLPSKDRGGLFCLGRSETSW